MAERILVVDDDPHLCNLIELVLSNSGYHIRIASNCKDALNIVQVWDPDLILLDIMLPNMDGYEICRQLQHSEATANIPIIFLSAKSMPTDIQEGFETGGDDYITKPFSIDNLRLRVMAHLRRNKRSRGENTYRRERIIPLPLVLHRRRSGVFLKSYRISKRLFDILMAAFGLIFALPVMAAIAVAVRLDSPGPILFVQDRTGWNGRRFKMLKFRTMHQNAEELKEQYLHLNELQWPDFKIADDPRVTRVGRFLRRTSLDELPQIFNILIGDMSFVGPRPTSFDSSTYRLWQTERLEVAPGLTGLWQVVGRADIDFEERAELDIEYIERQSWALDLHILFRTFGAVLSGRGAR